MKKSLLVILFSCFAFCAQAQLLAGAIAVLTVPASGIRFTTFKNSTGAGGHGTNCTISTVSVTNDLATLTSGSQSIAQLDITKTSGKWKYSVIVNYNNSTQVFYGYGVSNVDDVGNGQFPSHFWEYGVGVDVSGAAYSYKYMGGGATLYGTVPTSGDTINICVDIGALKMWVGKNQTWFGSGNPDAGTNASGTIAGTTFWFAIGVGIYTGGTNSMQVVASNAPSATTFTQL